MILLPYSTSQAHAGDHVTLAPVSLSPSLCGSRFAALGVAGGRRGGGEVDQAVEAVLAQAEVVANHAAFDVLDDELGGSINVVRRLQKTRRNYSENS